MSVKNIQKHYNKLVGMTIKKVFVVEDEFDEFTMSDEPMIAICAVNAKGEKFLLHLLSDPEGNGTGFIEIEPWDGELN